MKSLKNLLLSIPLIAGLVFSSINSQAQTKPRMIINPWSQPHKTLNHYGSGDVNKDSIIDWNDYSAIDFISNDESDIDGQIPSSTTNDKNILNNFLSKITNHLPSQWNELSNLEKTSWFEKMLEIDSTEYIDSANWDCGYYAIQTEIDFSGPEIQNPAKFDEKYNLSLKNLGKFNLPVCTINSLNINGDGHGYNAILIGDDIMNFSDWRFFDNSPWVSDTDVKPGDWSMGLNTDMDISYATYYDKDGIARGPPPFIKFWLKDGQVDSIYVDTDYLVQKDPRYDHTAPNISLSFQDGASYPKLSEIEISATDSYSFLDSLWYKINNEQKIYIPCSEDIFIDSKPVYSISKKIPLNLPIGKNKIEVKTWDIAGNIKDTIINFTITDIPEIKKPFETSVYPNPTNENVTFEYNLEKPENVSLELYNIQGKKLENIVKESKIGNNKLNADLSSYSSGIYFYTISSEDKKYFNKGKVVKE